MGHSTQPETRRCGWITGFNAPKHGEWTLLALGEKRGVAKKPLTSPTSWNLEHVP